MRAFANLVASVGTASVVLAAAIAPASAQDTPLADDPRVAEALHVMELWLEGQLAYEDHTGFSAGIVHDQELVWSEGFGYSDLATQAPATPSTMYSICSISKLFTSVAVMQLRDQGLLSLDDPVSQHLAWFDIDEAFPDRGPVTVEGLLTHSSGLPRESAHPYWTGPDYPFPTAESIREDLETQETLYPARERFQYSNLGLTLAGEIVAEKAGHDYTTYINEAILSPLGLDDTRVDISEARETGRLATGYTGKYRDGERRIVSDYSVRGIGPAAGFTSTVEDLARFASWQFRLLEKGGNEVLDANTLREMHRVHWVNPDWNVTWGLGFSVARSGSDTFVGHGGSCPGYRTQLQLHTRDQVAAIFMTNHTGTAPSRFTRQMHALLAPALKAAAGDSDPHEANWDFEEFVGRYASSWGGDTEIFHWKGSLGAISLPTMNPSDITRLEHVEDNVFRRVLDDGDLGEAWIFERDDQGRPVRLNRHGNYSERVND